MSTHNIPTYLKNRKYICIMPPDLALLLTLISSNYLCLEHIFMVPKVFEPLKFYCSLKEKIKRRPFLGVVSSTQGSQYQKKNERSFL